jgi:uncharacterized C2H2 Zn-finger protein
VAAEATVTASLDTPLASTSYGFQLLQKFGWRGQGLGADEQGRAEPVRFAAQDGLAGLGKTARDHAVLESTASKSKDIRSVVILKETEEEREAREALVAQKQAIEAEKADVLRKFRCDYCDKAYTKARNYEEHLNSYDHAHTKRKAERIAEEKAAFLKSGEWEKRRERERQREEAEWKRRGLSSGFASSTPVLVPAASTSAGPKLGFKKVAPAGSATPAPPLVSAPSDARPAIEHGPAPPQVPSAPLLKLGGLKRLTTPSGPPTATASATPVGTTQAALRTVSNAFGSEDEDEIAPGPAGGPMGKRAAMPKVAGFKLKRP